MMELAANRMQWSTGDLRLPVIEAQPGTYPYLDLCAVTYNSVHWLDDFFDSIAKQNYPLNRLNVFVVDNGSTDGTVQTLERIRQQRASLFGQFEVRCGPNVGFGMGNDHAIRLGGAEFLVITNVDLVVEHDTLSRLVAAALADTKDVACWEARQKPFEHPKYYDPATGETTWNAHALVLLRRTAYEAAGGYDPDIFMYGEDVELSYRLRSAGYRLRYVAASVIWHFTREDVRTIKPAQHTGSILANALLRARYGTSLDAFSGFIGLLGCVFRQEQYQGARRAAVRNIATYFSKFAKFAGNRGVHHASYAFRGWDYELMRENGLSEAPPYLATPPMVSIIIRTHKGRENILKQALASSVCQTYPNIEIIVVEDGGNTMADVVATFSIQTTRTIRFKGIPKAGRSVAGNTGMAIAAGAYINFLDDDDLLFHDHVETLVGVLLAEKAAAAYALALEVETQFDASYKIMHESSFRVPPAHRQPFCVETIWNHNYIPIQSCLFERRLYVERGGFNANLDALEDWNLWLRYSHNESFAYVPKVTSVYRIPADVVNQRHRGHFLHSAYDNARNLAGEALERDRRGVKPQIEIFTPSHKLPTPPIQE